MNSPVEGRQEAVLAFPTDDMGLHNYWAVDFDSDGEEYTGSPTLSPAALHYQNPWNGTWRS